MKSRDQSSPANERGEGHGEEAIDGEERMREKFEGRDEMKMFFHSSEKKKIMRKCTNFREISKQSLLRKSFVLSKIFAKVLRICVKTSRRNVK
jgi:hypothetical protein